MTPGDPQSTSLARLDRVRTLLAFALVVSFVSAMGVFAFVGMPSDNKDILTYMAGQLSGMATSALAFYFTKGAGQDQADAAKTDNTRKMAEAITATASAARPDGDKPTGRPGDPVHTVEEGS